MRKITSSAFILLLLLLSLWVLSTWYFANKNKTIIEQLLIESELDSSRFLDYERVAMKHSVFSSTAQYSLNISSENVFSDILSALKNQLLVNINIYNGPLLFDKKGIDIGNSVWKVSLDKSNIDAIRSFKFKQKTEAVIRSSFDKKIYYELPIQSLIGNFNITGFYDPVTRKGSGEIQIENFLYKDLKQSMKANQASIKYQHVTDTSNEFQLNLNSDVPEFLYQHKLMSKHINLNLTGNSKITSNLQKLNLTSSFDIKQEKTVLYPIDKSQIQFKITELDLSKLSDLSKSISQLENLTEQKQWILDEQGEVPEGQDQIWQRQDNIEQIIAKLPSQVNKLLMLNDQALTNFSISTQYDNKESTLLGSIYPISEGETDSLSSTSSLLSFAQAEADVNLDQKLLNFIATQLPIKNNKFKLTYKDNSLLMQ